MKTTTFRAAIAAALTIAASVALPTTSFASGANLITNGGFESRKGSGNLSGGGYGYASNGNNNIPTDWVLSGTMSHLGLRKPGGTGDYAFMFENPGTSDTVSQSFAVLYRGIYRLSFKHGIYSSNYGSTTTKATLTPSGGSAVQVGSNWAPSSTSIQGSFSATTAVIAPQTYTLTFVPVSSSKKNSYAYSMIDDVVFALDTLVLEANEEISASTAIAPDAITLGAGATLNLTLATTSESMSGVLTLGEGSKIVLAVPDATAGGYSFATGGITLPSGASDASAFFTAPVGYEISFSNNGATLLVMKPTTAVTAEWKGNIGGGGFTDPANWTCHSAGGSLIENGLPGEYTKKYILAADADWTSTNLTLAAGVTLDLNGHNLTVANITGSGTVVDLANDPDHTFYADANGVMYLEMEYLQTTGTYSGGYNWGNQYIDTGYHHNRNTVTEVKVAIMDTPSNNNWYCYYGSRDGYNDNQFGGWIRGTVHYKGVQAAEGNLSKSYTKGVPFITHLEQNGPCTIDGWQFDTGKGDTSGNLTDWLFAINHNGAVGSSFMAKARMYYCVIQEKDGENLVVMRNFRPVMRISDGKPGMLDIENGVFYVNARTGGDFLVLPVKKSATPAASSLTITVAENETLSLANVAQIGGNIKVVKAGAGTLTVPTTGVYFTGGVDVQAGTLSIPGPVTSLEGSNLGNVTVASGAKATIPATDGAKYGEAFTLNGGTLELVCSGTATPVTTYITNSIALNTGAKIRFDTSALDSTEFLLSTDGFTLGEGVESAVSCAELSAPLETMAEASGANGIHVLVLTEPVTAVWTGAANNNVFSDPGNWSCSNILGGALSSAVPDAKTEKLILGANADWTSTNLTLAAGMTLDLNGHNLVVANLTGGTVVDLSDNTANQNVFTASDGMIYQKTLYTQATQEGANNKSTAAINKIQYVDTGYNHTSNTVVDIRVEFQDVSYSDNYGYAVFYGCRHLSTSATTACQLGGWIHGSKFYYYDTAEHDGSAAKVNTIYDVHLDKGGASYANYADGTRAAGLGTGNKNGPNTWGTDYIFANNQVSNGGKYWPCRCKVYSCKVYEGSEIKRDFVPVVCLSGANAGKAGFWCTVTEAFYGNSGYGTLTSGPAKKSSTVAAGSVTITVAEEETLSIANVAPIYGNVKVVKAGAGTLTVPTTGVYFTGGIDVSAGMLSIAGPVTSIEGLNLGNVTAASGTKVTIPATDGLKYGEVFTLNGSTLELVCSGTAEPVTTYITNSVALNAGAKIRFDTTALQATQFLLSTDGFTLGTGVDSAISRVELSDDDNTQAEASGANGILVTVVTAPVTAVWTGAANNNNLSDPGNWSCTNVVGGAIENAIPDAHTVNYVLAVDADWSAATVTIPEGATLNMSGHRLKVSGLAGTGTITDAASGYVALEYLQGSGSQYIDTGYTMNSGTADFKALFTATPTDDHWFGVFGMRSSGSEKAAACVFVSDNGSKGTAYFWRTMSGQDVKVTSLGVVALNTDYTFHIDKSGTAPSTITGGSLTNATFGTASSGTSSAGSAYIFNLKQGGGVWNASRGARMRLYYLTFSENGEVVRDFVPARRLPDGVLGLYDKKNGTFRVNAGSGSFTGGNVKSDLALNPVAGGELEVYVPEGQTVTISTVNITGSVKLVKTGLGTLAMAKAQTYLNGTEVEAGTIKPSTSSIATPYGEVGSKISATAGGTVDFNGNANMNKYVYDFAGGAKALNGGAAISSGAFTFTSFYTPVSTGTFTASLTDGTTLDLTEWNGSWPISNVTTPAGATVTVKVDMDSEGFRTLAKSKDAETGKNNGKLLSFGGARPANAVFVPDAASANRCRFIEDENGDIILAFLQGFTILLK